MSSAYEVQRYRPEHKGRIIELQTQLWSADARLNAAYFEWKYEQNPYLGASAVYLLSRGAEIVGMRGFFGGIWEAGLSSHPHRLYCADDLVIAPEYRNRGLFTALMKGAFDDLASGRDGFALALSAGPMTMLGSLTMGWRSIGSMRPVGRESRGAARRRRIAAYLGKRRYLWRFVQGGDGLPLLGRRERFASLDAGGRRGARRGGSVRLAQEPRPEAMAELVERLGHDGRIRHVRDARYFAWRFRNPRHEYRFLYLGESELDGYLVLQRYVTGDTRARVQISDWEAVDAKARASLLEAAIDRGRFSWLGTWTGTLSGDVRRLLGESGFRDVSAERSAAGWPTVLVRPLRLGLAEKEWALAGRPLLELPSWDLRMLYSMYG